MKRKLLCLFLSLSLVLSLALTGCSDTEGEQQGQGEEEQGGETSDKDPVTIRVASWREADRDVYEEMADKFEEEYDWITVDLDFNIDETSYYTNLQADLVDGKGPDVFDVHPSSTFTDYVDQGIILSLDDLDFLDNYSDAARAVTTIDGTNYAFMNSYNLVCIIYNKEIFKEVGVEPPATFDEFVEICKKLRDAGYGGIAYSGADSTFSGLSDGIFTICCGSEADKDLVEGMDSGKYTDLTEVDGAEEALRTLQAFRDNNLLYDASEGTSTEQAISLFAQGMAPMLYSGTYLFGTKDTSFPDIDAGIFALPTLSDNGKQYGQGGQCSVVNAASEHTEEAKLWIDFIARQEISSLYCSSAITISTIDGVTLDFEGGDMLSEGIEGGVELLPIFIRNNKDLWNSEWKELRNSLLYGDADYDTAVVKYTEFLTDLNLAGQ